MSLPANKFVIELWVILPILIFYFLVIQFRRIRYRGLAKNYQRNIFRKDFSKLAG